MSPTTEFVFGTIRGILAIIYVKSGLQVAHRSGNVLPRRSEESVFLIDFVRGVDDKKKQKGLRVSACNFCVVTNEPNCHF